MFSRATIATRSDWPQNSFLVRPNCRNAEQFGLYFFLGLDSLYMPEVFGVAIGR
jgi:hypothetical protein